MQSITIKNNQHFTATAIPTSPDGQTGLLVPSDVPTWTSSDTAVITVVPSADGMTCVVTAVGKIASAHVDVQAKIIAFGPAFTSTFNVVIDPNPADHFEFTFNVPVNN